MKINNSGKAAPPTRSEVATKPDSPAARPAPAPAHKGWVAAAAGKNEAAAFHAEKKAVAGAATAAVATAVVAHTDAHPAHQHPVLERFGVMMGLGLGVIVTEALALSKEWNARLVDKQGNEVEHIPGADKIGEHDLRKRHEQFVGPKITALVDRMPPGPIHDLFAGLGKGATQAPGASYRLEAGLADMFRR